MYWNKVLRIGTVLFLFVLCAQAQNEPNYEQTALAEQYNANGYMLLENQEYKRAITQFRKAIATDPQQENFYLNIANAYLQLEQLDSVYFFYKEGAAKVPESGDLNMFLGERYYKTAQYDKAILFFTNAIRSPGAEERELFYLYYFKRGNTYLRLKKYAEAEQDFSKVIEVNPVHYGAFTNRGMARYNLKRKKEACADWDKAVVYGNQQAKTYLSNYCK